MDEAFDDDATIMSDLEPAGTNETTFADVTQIEPAGKADAAGGEPDENPVVARLLAEAARRRAEATQYSTLANEEMTAPAGLAVETAVSAAAPIAVTPPVRHERSSNGTKRIELEIDLLRGVALELVRRDAISERRAVSVALQARDAGVGFIRALASDRSNVDMNQVYGVVGELVGMEPLLDRGEAVRRLAETDWLTTAMAEHWQILPLAQERQDETRVAAVDPFDVIAKDWVKARCPTPELTVIPIHPDAYFEGLRRFQAMEENVAGADGLFTPITVTWSREEVEKADLGHMDIPAVVNYVIHRADELGASDLHIEPTGDALLVRCRVDGVLREELSLPAGSQNMVASRVKVLANLDVAERRLPQDGRIGVMIQDRPIDIRVSSLPTVHGEKMVLRLLDEGALRPRIEEVGLPDHELRTLLDKVNAPFGLILLSGPTGSGKTTTLYSCLSSIDRVGRNVVTVEDPVEYRLKGVHQTQVDENLGMTFASGLRAILRQDPDVIMVGECRDTETAQMAVQASLTGHLVFSTIHANDAAGVVNRLIDMGIDPFLVANSLSMSLAQRLVRVHCNHCQTVVDGRDVLANLRAEGVSLEKLEHLGIDIAPDLPAVVTLGCAHCRHTGYNGRQAVFEALALDDDLRSAVMSDNFDLRTFRRYARDGGMHSMLEHALTLVEEGRTSYSEVVRVLGEV